jgi:hypothetical protein
VARELVRLEDDRLRFRVSVSSAATRAAGGEDGEDGED